MSHIHFRSLGLLFWIVVAVSLYVWAQPSRGSQEPAPVAGIADFFFSPRVRVEAIDPSRRLREHDPVFFQKADQTWTQIGHVESVSASPEQPIVIRWHGDDMPPDQFRFVQFRSSGTLASVVATMLPPEKRQRIQQRLADAMQVHGEELAQAFVPLVQQSLRQSIPVIEEEVRLAVERHRAEVDSLASRWNDEVVGDRLIPLAQREILPIVRTHGEPTAESIGRELWDRASIWRFGWRVVYDRSPLPQRNLVQEEWDRFVEEEAVPVFEDHMDDIVVSIQRIVSDVAANEAVRGELADVATEISADPEARRLVREILKEALVDNERLRDVWREIWTSDEARAALNMAGDRLEPLVRSIGDEIFGSEQQGIDPNFARVLRNQILGKDRRWIVAEPIAEADIDTSAAPGPKRIELASTSMTYPIVYLADPTQSRGDL